MKKGLFVFSMLIRMFKLSILRRQVKFRFHKVKNKWYVDYPEYPFSPANLEMVFGADEFCEKLADGKDEVDVLLSLSYIHGLDECLDIEDDGEEYGRNYNVYGKGKNIIWLCPVMLYTFGFYPKRIHVKKIV